MTNPITSINHLTLDDPCLRIALSPFELADLCIALAGDLERGGRPFPALPGTARVLALRPFVRGAPEDPLRDPAPVLETILKLADGLLSARVAPDGTILGPVDPSRLATPTRRRNSLSDDSPDDNAPDVSPDDPPAERPRHGRRVRHVYPQGRLATARPGRASRLKDEAPKKKKKKKSKD